MMRKLAMAAIALGSAFLLYAFPTSVEEYRLQRTCEARIDTNRNGKLEREELLAAYKRIGCTPDAIYDRFSGLDINIVKARLNQATRSDIGSLLLDSSEINWRNAYAGVRKLARQLADTDHDGMLSYDEVRAAVLAHGRANERFLAKPGNNTYLMILFPTRARRAEYFREYHTCLQR